MSTSPSSPGRPVAKRRAGAPQPVAEPMVAATTKDHHLLDEIVVDNGMDVAVSAVLGGLGWLVRRAARVVASVWA